MQVLEEWAVKAVTYSTTAKAQLSTERQWVDMADKADSILRTCERLREVLLVVQGSRANLQSSQVSPVEREKLASASRILSQAVEVELQVEEAWRRTVGQAVHHLEPWRQQGQQLLVVQCKETLAKGVVVVKLLRAQHG